MTDITVNGHRSLSVFFPCYNEEENVRQTADKAIEVLEKLGIDYEAIIVDDGSADHTAQIADQLAAGNPKIRVVHHPVNRGYGAALQSGFLAAEKNLVFYTDGDGQFDLAELPPLLPLIENFDIVSCYRLDRKDNFIRKLNGWAWTKLVSFLFGLKLRDIDCAFKLYKREIFDNINMVSSGALIDTEILARSVRKGYTVAQKGVHHYPRVAGQQTGANIKVVLRAFKELFKLHRRIRRGD
ncbi:MAG: glycosyltransferase family 2 protein [Phycisphaerae bacterium]|nr:glycosyltransferase family 2 protein [Phycisphaerae bacterium]